MGSSHPNINITMVFHIIVLLATFALTSVKGACQLPGDAKCFSASAPIGFTGDSCCTGTKCQPWLAAGATLTGAEYWYCQYADPLPVNGLCGNKQGQCDTAAGLSCVGGVCSAATTTTTTTPTTTTTAFCDAEAGDLCLDNQYGLSWTCCSPYTCTTVTDRSSVCKGTSLALGETCFSASAGSLGDCADPNFCLDEVCTAKDSACIQPVNGLCYSADIGQTVGKCCAGSICIPSQVTGETDYFCQQILDAGANCNQAEHRGICKLPDSFCVDSICKTE